MTKRKKECEISGQEGKVRGEICNPTWEAAGRIHLCCIERGSNEAAIEGAKLEIIRGLKILDKFLAKYGYEGIPK